MPRKTTARRRKGNPMTTQDDNDDDNDFIDDLSSSYTIADSVFNDESFSDILDFNDDQNDTTESTSDTNPRINKLVDILNLSSIISTERTSSSKRESYLRALFQSITQHATGPEGQEILLNRLDDVIFPLCATGLRSSPAIQYASCRVLEATSIIVGEDMDIYTETIHDMLISVVKATGRACQVRCAALRAVSMATFICSSCEDTKNIVLDLCEHVCANTFRGEDVSPLLRATGLDCWAFLSTTMAHAYLAGDTFGSGMQGRGLTILPLLSECLDHKNMDMRCAAGECVALIHEARLDLGIDEEESENNSERKYRRGSWDGSEFEVLMDEVKQRVAELSSESGHHMSKKTKKEQRATFREFMSTIVDDESPNEVVAFRGGQLTLTSWREIIQLNFIRHCLQGGFQIQLMTNPTLQSIFGADGSILNAITSMSQVEKRLTLSKTSDASKAADIAMNKNRKSRINAQNYFLTADGEDI